MIGCLSIAVTAVLVLTSLLFLTGSSSAKAKTAKSFPAFRVISKYPRRSPYVFSGSLGTVPHRGSVLVERDSPSLFVSSTAAGPLRIVAVAKSNGDILFRSSKGLSYVLNGSDFGSGNGFYELGPKLDPEHLPKLAPRGFVIPVTFGTEKMIVLWSLGNPKGGFPTPPVLYGHIDGFRLPAARPLTALDRPLIGGGGKLYRIDPEKRRLVRVPASEIDRSKLPTSLPGNAEACVSWPAINGVSYRSCPDLIIRDDDGVEKTILSESRPDISHNFVVLLPSPDGKTLLLEQDSWACGTAKSTAFLPADGGPQAFVEPPFESSPAALGWINQNDALVTATTGECAGASMDGSVYVVNRNSPDDPYEISNSNQPDATLWGRPIAKRGR